MTAINETEPTESLTIQEVAGRTGLSTHTLRYYERIGLVEPIPRGDSSGHRRYPVETVERIEGLACLRQTGMSIEHMRQYITQLERGTDAAAEQKALFVAHKHELCRELEAIQTRLEYVSGKVAFWEAVESGDKEKAKLVSEHNRRLAKSMTNKKE